MSNRALSISLLLCAFALGGCGSDDAADPEATADTSVGEDTSSNDPGESEPASTEPAEPEAPVEPEVPGFVPDVSPNFSVRATVGQIYLWNATPDTAFEVLGPDGDMAATGTTDSLGSLVVRELEPGDGYQVHPAANPDDLTNGLTVHSIDSSRPDDDFYESQPLEEGFGYLTMRDGTTLSVFVSLPGPVEDGPYPTLVNYSGYSPSQPGQTLGADLEALCGDFPILCNMPGHPSGLLAGMAGYATVGVNMRGTGCSGGAYDYFEPLQLLDGYDIIELVANQSWVKHNKVGMAGLSYPGISQLFVAKTRPPSLAAITPLSVLADSASSTLAPGGIYNQGFALAWIDNVMDKAQPYGHGWIQDLVDAGDTICEENQLLHGQMVNVVQKALDNPYYTDEVAKPLDPTAFAHLIEVPVFIVGQWQDEQTGPHFPALFDKFTSAPIARFTVTNGVHVDGYSPQVLMEWKSFLDLYVAQEVPNLADDLRALIPLFFLQSTGAALEVGPNRFEGYTSHAEALADYEAEPPLRVIFETGASPDVPAGAPQGTFEQHFDAWPLPETEAWRWYFQPDGGLGAEAPGEEGGASYFHHDPEAGERTILPGGGVEDLQPNYTYGPLVEDKAVAFITEPLEEDLVMIGHGSIDLWLKSTATDADLEVNLTEVRPDGEESLIQSGWLRASHRALRDDATELRPVKSHYEEDIEPLVPGEWHEVRVELMPFVHIFRAGSQVRISVDTPGDSRASWFFILLDHTDEEIHTVGHSAMYPSSIALPVIPTVEVETPLPECNALRGQPCREYTPHDNPTAE